MVYVVWCMVYGVWYVLSEMWSVECGMYYLSSFFILHILCLFNLILNSICFTHVALAEVLMDKRRFEKAAEHFTQAFNIATSQV